jgi:hypothetical protein
MKEMNELIVKLKMELDKNDPETTFGAVLNAIEEYYTDNLFLNPYEVSILLTNKEKTILSFASPAYLINSGMIPVTSTEAYAATIYRTGRSFIENNFQQQKHLGIFEIIRTPEGKIMPIHKMMGTTIATEEEKIGVIEISRRGSSDRDIGDDFTPSELQFLEKTIKILAPFIKKIVPENFRGKIT